ncbi:MAG: hypothetical protein FK734_06065 [Asgard group archaeon]|nr:hypothetical protein [Asgard group archaeon]
MSEKVEDNFKENLPARRSIHSEIEEILIKKLFTVVENIEVKPDGELNFDPYDDRLLIQLEALIEKKFDEKVFNRKVDVYIVDFLERIKKERVRRDF